jgi:NADPH-dependent 2,4-dienoyl-CoA reductase/sulfur reductase-like enzyme
LALVLEDERMSKDALEHGGGKRLVVVGGDAAGMSAASQAKRRCPELEVVVLEQGAEISYAACGMPFFVSGVIGDAGELRVLGVEDARRKRKIDVRLGHRVVGVDPAPKEVRYQRSGTAVESMSYDALLLATGARPIMPAVGGVQLDGVFVLRSLEDGVAIRRFVRERRCRKVVIAGAGLIGLEMAEAFRSLGCQVTLLKRTAKPLGELEPEMSEVVEEELAKKGCVLLKKSTLESVVADGAGEVTAVKAGGEVMETDLVLLAVGVAPSSELASEAGIELGAGGAVAVDDYLETSAEDVFAAGDCAEQTHRVSGERVFLSQALSANRMGKIAGGNIAARLAGSGALRSHPGTLGTVLTKVFDLEVAATGLNLAGAARAGIEAKFSMIRARSRAHYYPGGAALHVGLVFEANTGRVLGGQLVGKEGAAKRLDVLAAAIDGGMDLERVSRLDLAYCPPYAPVWDPLLTAASVALKSM